MAVLALLSCLMQVAMMTGSVGAHQNGNTGQQKDYTGHQVLRTGTLNQWQAAYLRKHVDFWTPPLENGTEGVSFSVAPEERKEVRGFLKKSKVAYQVWIADMQTEIERERGENCVATHHLAKRESIWDSLVGMVAEGLRSPRNIQAGETHNSLSGQESKGGKLSVEPAGMNWSRYHRLYTIHTWMQRLATRYPRTVSLQVIGRTEEGRDLLVVRVGSGNRPAVFVEGGIHAREWISPAVVTYMVEKLVTDPTNKDLINFYDFYFLPVTNPDGYEYSHTADRMWRKNRAQSSSILNILANCRGVDLNRNFGYQWGEAVDLLDISGKGGTPLPCLETFHGDEEFSELESRAVRDFVLSKKNIVAYLAYHSFGQKILYPWSHTNSKVADWEELHHMANTLAEAVFRDSGGRDYYKIGTAADIQYVAAGGSDDWARGEAGIKWVFLVELPGKGHGFLLPNHHVPQVCRSSLAGLRGFLTALADKL